MMKRRPSGAAFLLSVALLLVTTSSARGEVRFLQGASEQTIKDVVYPWTQTDACSCCVCWETALGTILAYWDDLPHQGEGPWEKLLYGGGGFDAFRFQETTGALYRLSGLGCMDGTPSQLLSESTHARKTVEAYTNTLQGYRFQYDEDDWVWFGTDIKDEIDADRPVYYAYYPEGNAGHAVTVVGYDDQDETLYIYKNWLPVVTRRGFDEASNHSTLNITPAGRSSVPDNWTCPDGQWEGRDGCNCECGGPYDPDCDDETADVIGCGTDMVCSYQGECQSACAHECSVGTTQCTADGKFQLCGNHDNDPCFEWGEPQDCGGGSTCEGNKCVATCEPQCLQGFRECIDSKLYRLCNRVSDAGCPMWGETQTCPDGTSCSAGYCRSETGPVEAEDCVNEVDDDGDGLVDCQDPGCNNSPACGIVEICDNQQDDDGDGLIDCVDPNCHGDARCQSKDDGGCHVGGAGASTPLLPLLLMLLLGRFLSRRKS